MSMSPIRSDPGLNAERIVPVVAGAPAARHEHAGNGAAAAAIAPHHSAWHSSNAEVDFQVMSARNAQLQSAGRNTRAGRGPSAGNQPFTMRMRDLRRIYSAMKGPLAERELEQESGAILSALESGSELDEFFGEHDGAARFIALRDAQERLLAETGSELEREKIETTIKRLWEQHQQRIVAEINTAGAIAIFSKKISERDQLRRLYYDAIITGTTLRETFERLMQAFGAPRMHWALRILRNAIREDMGARTLAADVARLEQGTRSLGELSRIHSMRLYARDLGTQLAAAPLHTPEGAFEFVRNVLRYMESPGGGKRFLALCETVVGKDRSDSAQVQLLVRRFLRDKLPLTMWTDLNVRESLTTPTSGTAAAA